VGAVITPLGKYEPLSEGQRRLQLTRVAAELTLFPFTPGRVRRHYSGGPDVALDSQFTVTATLPGAPVYYDLLAEGGHGTRWDARRVIDRVLLSLTLVTADDSALAAAADAVVLLRVRDPERVTTPLLPDIDRYCYTPVAIDEERAYVDAARIGRWVVAGVDAHADGTSPRTARGITNLATIAAKAWRRALAVAGDDAAWALHLTEQTAMADVAKALRVDPLRRRRRMPTATRLITLDE